MPYLNCPQCGLTVPVSGDRLTVEHCPRCLTRRQRRVTMIGSDTRAWPPEITTTATTGTRAPTGQPTHPRRPTIPGELIIDTHRDADAVTLALSGELDLATVEQLAQELVNVANDEIPRLVLDLSGLRFMDTSGLHVLIGAAERYHADRRRLSFMRGIPLVQRLFELTAAHHAITFDD
jgi:anti-sigma B factor antagonist